MDRPPGSPDAVYVKGVFAPPIEAVILRLTALPRVAVWVAGVVTDSGRPPFSTQPPVALLHRLCMGNVPPPSATFPAGSLSPQSWPPQAHLSATSPPLTVSAVSSHPVPIGSVMASISSCPPVMVYPSSVPGVLMKPWPQPAPASGW